MSRRTISPLRIGLVAALLAAAFADASARAQEPVPIPRIPDANYRSGLLTRWTPIEPHLPPDPRRSYYHNLRWTRDPEPLPKEKNCMLNGGLYGATPRWKSDCTACYSPYFRGAPGENTIKPGQVVNRPFRVVENFVHPFKPVGMYYQNGCYSPVYDLDPFVPGPGPFPYPVFPNWLF